MPLDPNIFLQGQLNDYTLEGDVITAMNLLYEYLSKQGDHFLGKLVADAQLGTQTGLYHWTCKTPGQTMFFTASQAGPVWQLQIYGHGKHTGDNNKEYKLFTWEHGRKEKLYSF